jgi:acyl carrier protein
LLAVQSNVRKHALGAVFCGGLLRAAVPGMPSQFDIRDLTRTASYEMYSMQATELITLMSEVAALIVEALNLEVQPQDIEPDEPLYGDGLGLDSIDMLEISLVISKHYGFQMRSDNENNEKIYSSLRALTTHIASQRTK